MPFPSQREAMNKGNLRVRPRVVLWWPPRWELRGTVHPRPLLSLTWSFGGLQPSQRTLQTVLHPLLLASRTPAGAWLKGKQHSSGSPGRSMTEKEIKQEKKLLERNHN